MLARFATRQASRAAFLCQRVQPTAGALPGRFQSTAAVNAEEPKKAAPPAFTPTPGRKYEFFQDVEMTPEGVAIIRFDCPKSVNSISFDLSREARELWANEIANNNSVKAVVFSSGKPGMFIAGADIFDVQALENKQDLVGVIEEGMDFFQSMKKKKVPLVCAIDGPALGGGLEWAMYVYTFGIELFRLSFAAF